MEDQGHTARVLQYPGVSAPFFYTLYYTEALNWVSDITVVPKLLSPDFLNKAMIPEFGQSFLLMVSPVKNSFAQNEFNLQRCSSDLVAE